MALGLIGRKEGMTKVFNDDGKQIPVTVISVEPNFISQVKSQATDGYDAIQLSTRFDRKANKAKKGHFEKAGVQSCKVMREFRVQPADVSDAKTGSELGVSHFEGVKFVDVAGVSKGKGFAGCIKRHNFSSQNMTHGNSKAHRKPGSTGQCQDPGRVFKGKKMAGQLGNVNTTVQNLEIVKVDTELSCVMLKGAVPGPRNGLVTVRIAKKRRG